MSTIIKAKNLHKSFGTLKILDGIDLEILAHTSTAIMGRSGEGKTTLLHILGTLDLFDSGSMEVCGIPLPSTNAAVLRNKHIGFIFQNYNLLEDFTTLENVLMPSRIGRNKVSKKSQAYDLGMTFLQEVGLEERAHFPARFLSGGERQRAAIARALCRNPDLILADEPSGNLDYTTSSTIHQLLLDTVRIHKKTLILVTHEPSFAKSCDECYLLSHGKLSKTELIASY